MRKRFLPLSFLLLFLCTPALAETDGHDETAENSVMAWLAAIDADDHAASWNTADTIVREEVTLDQWSGMLTNLRKQLGSLKSRTLESSGILDSDEYPERLHHFKFHSNYAEGEVTELLVLIRGEDGAWRVVNYELK